MDVRCVAREARRAVWLGSLMLSVAGVAEGQEASRLQVAVHASAPSETVPPDLATSRAIVVSDSTRGHPILRGAGIGALAGVGVGLAYGVYLNATNKCNLPEPLRCTHDEDGLMFILPPAYGALLGSVAGALVGALVR